jgi:hypothetical protein
VSDTDGEADPPGDELALLRAENAALRTRVAELLGAEIALHHMLLEARAIRGGRRLSREDVKLLGDPHAGSA